MQTGGIGRTNEKAQKISGCSNVPGPRNYSMNKISIPELVSFFNFLCERETEIFTCTIMDRDSKNVVSGFGKWFVTVKEILDEFPRLHEHYGGTLHVSLNQTNLTGRRGRDIQACRVLCVDLDRTTDSALILELIGKYGIQLIVESSPGRYHLYWRVTPAIGLETWKQFQLGLAQIFDGDRNLSDITHNIRVPGVPRGTKDGKGFTPQIVFRAFEYPELSYDDVLGLFPTILDSYEEAQKARTAARKRVKKARVSGADLEASAKELGRNKTLYTALVGWLLSHPAVPEYSFAEVHAVSLNAQFEVPMEEWEVTKVCGSSYQDAVDIAADRAQEQVAQLSPVSIDVLDTTSHGGTADSNTVLQTVVVTENGHGPGAVVRAGELFKYNREDPFLKDNLYSEPGLQARVIQRFRPQLYKTSANFLAFNQEDRMWRVQSSDRHSELFKMVKDCALDIIHEPEFAATFWAPPGKAPSAVNRRRAEDRFMSLRLHSQTVRDVRQSSFIKEANANVFDAIEELFHFKGGVVDMLTGATREARAEDYLLAQSDVVWDPAAECPWWLEFLHQVFGESQDPSAIVNFMQELFGYSISGSIEEQKIFLHSGDGCNGKSKVLSALATISGTYCTYTDPDELVRAKNGFARNIERFGSKIEGKRVVIIDDIDVKTNWNEAFVKNVTSPEVRARAEFEKSRLFYNRCTLHLGLNMAPAPDAENYGILRRMAVIPYNTRFEPSAKTGSLISKMIKEEAPGILRWAVEGYRRWKTRQVLLFPAELLASVEDYKEEHFKIEGVIDALFEVPKNEEDGEWEFPHILAQDVNHYLNQIGEDRQISPTELGIALKRKQGFLKGFKWDSERKNSSKAYLVKLKFDKATRNSLKNRL